MCSQNRHLNSITAQYALFSLLVPPVLDSSQSSSFGLLRQRWMQMTPFFSGHTVTYNSFPVSLIQESSCFLFLSCLVNVSICSNASNSSFRFHNFTPDMQFVFRNAKLMIADDYDSFFRLILSSMGSLLVCNIKFCMIKIVEFSIGEYKIKKIFSKRKLLNIENWCT